MTGWWGMAASSSTEPPCRYRGPQRELLLDVAEESIRYGLDHGTAWQPDPEDYAPPLREWRATFVTLQREGMLRGCIGSLEARRPLVSDVAENAYAAAFRDPRFPPLSPTEWRGLDIHLSILSPPEPLHFDSEQGLIAQLRPGIDGLILSEGGLRGTFLPSVWASLPEPAAFLLHLKQKAGLPAHYWSDTLTVCHYTTESFSRRVAQRG